MWRGAIIAVVLAFFSSLGNATATVICSSTAFTHQQIINNCASASTTTNSCFTFQTNLGVYVSFGFGGGVDNKYLLTRNTSVVEPGGSCPAGSVAVFMSISDYNAMIGSTNVIAELQKGWNYGVVGMLVVVFVLGFWIGWAMLGRAEGRSS